MSTNIAWKWTYITKIMNNYTVDQGIPAVLMEKMETFKKDEMKGCSHMFGDLLRDEQKAEKYMDLVGVQQDEDSITHVHSLRENNHEAILEELYKDLGIAVEKNGENQDYIDPLADIERAVYDLKITSSKDQTFFGKSTTIGDFDGDGIMELIFSAPGYSEPNYPQMGAVYKGKIDGTGINPDTPFLFLEEAYTRFGFALATIDINHDGIDDLAVSAPTYGEGEFLPLKDSSVPKLYRGKVLIFLGVNGTGLSRG